MPLGLVNVTATVRPQNNYESAGTSKFPCLLFVLQELHRQIRRHYHPSREFSQGVELTYSERDCWGVAQSLTSYLASPQVLALHDFSALFFPAADVIDAAVGAMAPQQSDNSKEKAKIRLLATLLDAERVEAPGRSEGAIRDPVERVEPTASHSSNGEGNDERAEALVKGDLT